MGCSFHLIAVFSLFPRYRVLLLGYVAVAGYFEFGETWSVVGEMKNRTS
ncbi:hypothetical protein MZB18_02815 [Haemophilus influenzae]|nr:hypothetical protein [Haemophilus influenzae]